jgi:cysteine desulfurase family protein
MSVQSVPRRYFDNAATSFPKPPGVAAAMSRYMTEVGAAGRGGYAEARQSAMLIRTCRERICRLINGESAEHVVFTLNATDALNLAIKGAARGFAKRTSRRLPAPPHAVITNMEHNSVLRPVNELAADGMLEVTRVNADPATGLVEPQAVADAVREGETAFVAINHASNVMGSVQAIEEIGRLVRACGTDCDRPLFVVDASQSLGHWPVDVHAAEIDLLAFPGHKGLLGPTGTGALYIRPGVEQRLATFREGGTGNVSELETQPTMMPEKYEAGSHNTVGIVGLSEGVAWLLDRGVDAVRRHEVELLEVMLDALRGMNEDGVRVLGEAPIAQRVGVVSFTHAAYSPAELATVLEAEFGILCRAGLQCAPLVHQMLGTAPPRGEGAVRLSLGPFLNRSDIDAAVLAISRGIGAADESVRA